VTAFSTSIRAYCAVNGAGETVGGVAFCEIADALGRRLISVPFSDVCDPLVSSPEAWNALFAQLQRHRAPIHLRCLDRTMAWRDARLAVSKRARWHTLSLDAAPETLWDRLVGSTQRAIRRAAREGVVVRPLEGAAGLREFLALHVALRKQKYRLLAQPPAFFEAVARNFEKADAWFPLGAYLGDRLIAATIYLRWRDTLYYKFNASALDALHLRPNGLLVWAGMMLGRRLGCQALDLGPSDDNQPGLIRFKRQFGAEERELRFLRYAPAGRVDERAAEVRHRLGGLTARLTRPEVPDEVAARAGALLYRFFA